MADDAGVADKDNPNRHGYCFIHQKEQRSRREQVCTALAELDWLKISGKKSTLFHPGDELAATCVAIVNHKSWSVPRDLIER
jgi:hypothetical protein